MYRGISMFNTMTLNQQQEVRDRFLSEHDNLSKQYNISPVPIGPYILVRMLEPEDISNGGIIIPTDERDQSAMRVGLVLAHGPTSLAGYELPNGKKTRGLNDYGLSVGDFVEYERHSGKIVSYAQFKGYRVLSDRDIYMVYKELL